MSEKTKTILVRCTVDVPVQVPDNEEYDVNFDIEENHCPGTGLVGAAIDALIKKHDEESTCWACSLNGSNTIIDYDLKT